MVVVMKKQAPLESIDHVLSEIKSLGFTPHLSKGESRTIIGAIGPAPTKNVLKQPTSPRIALKGKLNLPWETTHLTGMVG